jgi:hypothetical protein
VRNLRQARDLLDFLATLWLLVETLALPPYKPPGISGILTAAPQGAVFLSSCQRPLHAGHGRPNRHG